MDFAYSPKVEGLRVQLGAFMDCHVVPRLADWQLEVAAGAWPPSMIEPLKAAARAEGLWNLFLPALRDDEPGTRLANLEYAPLAEIMGRVWWASEAFNCSAPDTGNMELLHMFATPEQRERWLVPLLQGEIRSCFAMTEPDVASSDATNIRTRIARDGDHYVINGRKWFITGAADPRCKLCIVMGVTDPEAEPHARHSMVLVPMGTAGVEVVRNLKVMQHMAPEGHCEMRFSEVRVPVTNLLGEEGRGFALAQARLGPGRIHHCMRSIGQCELALELMCARAREREAFGRKLFEHGTVAEWIALSRLEIDQARLLVLRAAWLIDQHGNKAARSDVAMIKVVVPRLQTTVLSRAMQVYGAMGLTPDTPLALLWTWGRALQFVDGPDEVHLRSIARHELRAQEPNHARAAAYLDTAGGLSAMAWPDDPLPAIRHELHFGDRLVRCFVERPRSLYGLLEAAVGRDPDALALVEGDARLTYRDLAGQVERRAAGMAARGVAPGDRVALLLGNRPEFLVSLFAAARLGAIAVPLSIREQAPGLRYMLENAGAKLLIYEDELSDRLPQGWARDRCVAIGAAPTDGATFSVLDERVTAPPPHRSDEEDVAIILYTSGTTGRPKGAMLTHFNIAHSVMHYALCRGLGRDDRTLLAVPASHVMGLIAMLLTMVHVGGSAVLMRAFKARPFLELMAAEQCTITHLVPAMYHLCLLEPDFSAFDLSSWRIGGFGSAPMPEAAIARLAERLPHVQLVNGYGATETTLATTLMPFGLTARHPESVGQIVPCAEVRIMDEAGREVPPGEAGEIWIKGPIVVPGYWANDTATRAAFVAGFWRSGDIGAIDEAGYLRVLDRRKDMINRAGYKVFSAEVESVLSAHPQIVEAAVVAHPDPVLGEKVHAFVVARDEGLSAEEVRAFCRARLADYKVPEFVTIGTEPLPRNPLGKLQKHMLRERAAEMAQ